MQLVIFVIPNTDDTFALLTKDSLKAVIYFQYLPRLIRIYPLVKEVERTSGIFTERAWAGAAFNLFLYMLASHVSFIQFFFLMNSLARNQAFAEMIYFAICLDLLFDYAIFCVGFTFGVFESIAVSL